MENVPQQEILSNAPAPTGGLSWKGIVQVFSEPANFFEKLKTDPKILVPWLVFFVLILGFFLIAGDVITRVQYELMQANIAKQGDLATQQMPTFEQMRWSTIIGGPIVIMLSPLIAAILGYVFGGFVMGGRGSFKQVLSVMLYGEIIYAVGALILAPMMVAKNSIKISISLAAFFRDLPVESPWYVLLSKFGLFNIWEIIVIGIGLSIIYGYSRNKGYLLAVLSMGMISILHVLSAFVFGSMM